MSITLQLEKKQNENKPFQTHQVQKNLLPPKPSLKELRGNMFLVINQEKYDRFKKEWRSKKKKASSSV